jgi:hypothetical protein
MQVNKADKKTTKAAAPEAPKKRGRVAAPPAVVMTLDTWIKTVARARGNERQLVLDLKNDKSSAKDRSDKVISNLAEKFGQTAELAVLKTRHAQYCHRGPQPGSRKNAA